MHTPDGPLANAPAPATVPRWLLPSWLLRWVPLGREVLAFGIVGLIQICIDWMIFVVLTHFGVGPAAGNVTGRITAAGLGFWLNGRWTFAQKNCSHETLRWQSFVRYSLTWCMTTALSTMIVLWVDHGHGLHWAWAVKPVADALLAALSFLVSKYWIYRPSRYDKDVQIK
ncbi:MAG TPA: GtrA family protein [Dyella sp.]|uniref:GtrA family protein n=1 Tax=Dyella sp. TaxID=1869338 RepID=UPI002F93BBE8